MFPFYFRTAEAAIKAGDDYRTRRNWIGKRSLSLIYAKYCYRYAWDTFTDYPQRWFAAQQYGVCCRMQHRYIDSVYWLSERALPAAQKLKGADRKTAVSNILRDLGMTSSKLRLPDAAHTYLEQSLEMVAPDSLMAIVTGIQLARLEMQLGQLANAACGFTVEIIRLRAIDSDDARAQELYALLHAAQNDIALGCVEEARKKLCRAVELSENYGSISHKLKAWALEDLAAYPNLVQLIFHTITMSDRAW